MQGISLVHVVVTLAVILATANHYLLDAVGGAICVMVAVPSPGCQPSPRHSGRGRRAGRRRRRVLPVRRDAGRPQQVGGLLVLDVGADRRTGKPAAMRSRQVVRGQIDELPRFRQRPPADLGGGGRAGSTVAGHRLGLACLVPRPAHADGEPGGLDALNALRRRAPGHAAAAGPPAVAVGRRPRRRRSTSRRSYSSRTTSSRTASARSSTPSGLLEPVATAPVPRRDQGRAASSGSQLRQPGSPSWPPTAEPAGGLPVPTSPGRGFGTVTPARSTRSARSPGASGSA